MVIQLDRHLDEGVLLRWIDQAMSHAEEAAAAAHLGQCAACEATRVTLRRDALTVRRALVHDGLCRAPEPVVRHVQRSSRAAGRGRYVVRQAIRIAPWQVAATMLGVATLAASTASLTRHLRGDDARSSGATRGAAAAVAPVASPPPGLVSIAPLGGRLVIVFPRSSAQSSIRVERHREPFALFGAPHIERTPLVVLPGELRVQELPAAGADFELRIPAGVTQVHVRIGERTLARWTGSPQAWVYGRRLPLKLPGPG